MLTGQLVRQGDDLAIFHGLLQRERDIFGISAFGIDQLPSAAIIDGLHRGIVEQIKTREDEQNDKAE